MNTQNLAILLMATYFVCSLLLAYPIGRMAHNKGKGYVFRVEWYHKMASAYVFAFTVYFVGAYLLELTL